AVLAEHAAAFFDFGRGPAESPYMLRVVPVRPEKRALVPAIVHVDGSARPQTVPADGSPFARLLAAFLARTGVPMVLNTSFNAAGEPLVETPADALRCLLATGLDACAIGDWVVVKAGAEESPRG
ncbi:MAG: carbamoyltransferase, partial [Myxococcales bacterium]|nr:carbamoyltransferase [Myxococcales bacterium]